VLQQEPAGIEEERQRLTEWGSLLKKWTTSEKQRAMVEWERLSKMEAMVKQEEVTIGVLDAQAQELMEKAKELFVAAEARGEANIKAREDLNKQAIAIAHQEQAVAEREQELQEKEEKIANMLERRSSEVSSRNANLDTCENALEADWKILGDLHVEVIACDLAADLKANHLAFREK
jgi:hypothetical protein